MYSSFSFLLLFPLSVLLSSSPYISILSLRLFISLKLFPLFVFRLRSFLPSASIVFPLLSHWLMTPLYIPSCLFGLPSVLGLLFPSSFVHISLCSDLQKERICSSGKPCRSLTWRWPRREQRELPDQVRWIIWTPSLFILSIRKRSHSYPKPRCSFLRFLLTVLFTHLSQHPPNRIKLEGGRCSRFKCIPDCHVFTGSAVMVLIRRSLRRLGCIIFTMEDMHTFSCHSHSHQTKLKAFTRSCIVRAPPGDQAEEHSETDPQTTSPDWDCLVS